MSIPFNPILVAGANLPLINFADNSCHYEVYGKGTLCTFVKFHLSISPNEREEDNFPGTDLVKIANSRSESFANTVAKLHYLQIYFVD